MVNKSTIVNMFMQIGGVHNLLHFLRLTRTVRTSVQAGKLSMVMRRQNLQRTKDRINNYSKSQIEEGAFFVLGKLCIVSPEIEQIWFQNGGCNDIISRIQECTGIDSILHKSSKGQQKILLLSINAISSLRLDVFRDSLLDQGTPRKNKWFDVF